jgi:hypothetical protein
MPGPHPVLLGALSHTEPLEVPNMPTIDEALAIAQEHGLKIIACGEDKAPIHKGWREKASSDPDEIRKMFSDPRAKLVGVPMGKDNDLIAFDIDYREGNTPARNQALEQFGQELLKAHSARIHSTRNGGLHLILLNPTGVRKIPRNIMPKLEVVSEGFQIIWPTEGSGYEVVDDVPLDDLVEPDPTFLKVREKMKGISSSGGLMDAALAREIMLSDGEVGTRHDALLRMTYDFVAAAPGDLAPDVLCQRFESQFREVFGDYIEASRLEELMHWTWDGQTLGGSDLGNAMKGAIERCPERDLSIFNGLERPAFSVWGDQQDILPSAEPENPPPAAPSFTAPELRGWVGSSGDLPARRRWVLSQKLERERLSLLYGPPGSGKSSLAMVWSMVAASGTSVLYETAPEGPVKVVYWNGEDGLQELRRRFAGIRKAYPTMGSAVGDNLMLLPTDVVPLKLVEVPKDVKGRNPAPRLAAVEWLKEALAEAGASILVIDPLISSHRLREMDPAEMEVLFDVLRRIARELEIAVLVVHHAQGETSPGPILGAARHATRLVQMTVDQADKQRLPREDRFQFVQTRNGKSNNARHARDRWVTLKEVELGNGDTVPVAHIWDTAKNPTARSEVGVCLRAIQEEIDRQPVEAERRLRTSAATNGWLGNLLGEAFGLSWQKHVKQEERTEDEQRAIAKMKTLIGIMIEEGLVTEHQVKDAHYDWRPVYRLTPDATKIAFWSTPPESDENPAPPRSRTQKSAGSKKVRESVSPSKQKKRVLKTPSK